MSVRDGVLRQNVDPDTGGRSAELLHSYLEGSQLSRHEVVSSFLRVSLCEEHLRKCSWQQAGFNIFFYMFAASQIPFAISQMGWTWGAILFTLIVSCSWWSGYVLTECCVRREMYTWYDLGFDAFGWWGGAMVATLQTSGLVLTGIVQVQGAGSLWQQAFPDVPICSWQWILVNGAPYLFFMQIPSFGGASILKLATFLTVILTVWRVILFITLLVTLGPYKYVCYDGQTFSTVLSGASNMMFTFGVKNVLPEMTREMADPKDMHKAWTAANIVGMPTYALLGFWGVWAFGIFTQNAAFALQFKPDAAVLAYNIAAATTGYLPLIYGQICIFLKVELGYGVLPTDWWTVSNPDTNRFPRVPPVIFRLLLRTCIVLAYIFVAEALIGVGLGYFAALVGAVSISAFFFLPSVGALFEVFREQCILYETRPI